MLTALVNCPIYAAPSVRMPTNFLLDLFKVKCKLIQLKRLPEVAIGPTECTYNTFRFVKLRIASARISDKRFRFNVLQKRKRSAKVVWFACGQCLYYICNLRYLRYSVKYKMQLTNNVNCPILENHQRLCGTVDWLLNFFLFHKLCCEIEQRKSKMVSFI